MPQKIDLVYVYRPGGSYWAEREIIYSLRSVERYLRGVGTVWIASPVKPPQLVNVEWINSPDAYKNSHANTCLKVLLACLKDRVSDPFLVMNDDFYIVKEMWAAEIPAYTLGDLWHQAGKFGGKYSQRMRHTAEALANRGKTTLSFEAHIPMLVNKEAFIRALKPYDWETDPIGFLWRSLYANEAGIRGVPLYKDPKIFTLTPEDEFRAILAEIWCFSTSPQINAYVADYLMKEFAYPSRYEANGKLPDRLGL